MKAETVKTGIVYIIGAGPGHPGLIAVRGLEALQQCHAVIYDHLTPLYLLTKLNKDVELIDAGKEAGKHGLSQDDINRLLVDYARRGKNVGRFKGGDPFVFGRGGEEAIFLKQNGIPFEIIPGVTAGVAAPAYAGIPVTHRNTVTQTVFVTAHESNDKDAPQVDWPLLAKLQHCTIVGYMGVKTLPEITGRLIAAGMNPETPAAVISQGTISTQKTVVGTVNNISSKCAEAGITPPAVFIIGPTVELKNRIEWFEHLPLFGRRIVVTRAADQSEYLIGRLTELGAHAIPFPTIKTENAVDPEELQNYLEKSDDYEWIIFTSENGVRYFFEALFDIGEDIRCFNRAKIAAVGTGTSRALAERYVKTDFVPETFLTRVLAEELSSTYKIEGAPVLRIRGEPAPATVEDILSAAGAEVDSLVVYRIVKGTPLARIRDDLLKNGADLITFTSSSTVKNFAEILGREKAIELASESIVMTIGPMAGKAARDLGLPVHGEAEEFTIEGLIDAVLKWSEKTK